jgi:alkylhydroperoxidase family enzyme
MARVDLIPEGELAPGVRCYTGQTADGVLRGLGGYLPQVAERWLALYLPLCREDGALPLELKELVRFQIAGFYGCDHCRGFIVPLAAERGVTYDTLAYVLTPDDPAAPFSARERAMLRFTLKMATGKGQLSDADFSDVRLYFNEAQLVELGFLAALLIGYGRFTITGFQLVE